MNWCTINLACDMVCPTGKRRTIYWLMIFYLFSAGLLIAVTAGVATRRIQEGFKFQRRALYIQQVFNQNNSATASMPEVAENLKTALGAGTKDVQAVQNAQPGKIQTMLPLLIALLDQTNGEILHKLVFSQQSEYAGPELEFSIRVPAAPHSQPDFIQRWKDDPFLSQQFSSITPVTTRLGQVGNSEVQIMSYKVVFME